MIDQLKGEINARTNASTRDKTGGGRCVIYKAKDHGMWACEDESSGGVQHNIRRFYTNGKAKKQMKGVRKALRHFLNSWLHPANRTKTSMH